MNDRHLQEIFANYIDKFEIINNPKNMETYKWQVANHFKIEMDAALKASAAELPQRLKEVRKLTENLIDNATQPFYGLVKFAEREPETVREMFSSLLSVSDCDLSVRQKSISEFLKNSHELRDKYYPDSYKFKDDMHSVTSYLFLYDPDHNYIYKATHAQIFADYVEFFDEWGYGDEVDLKVYYRMCDELVEKIKNCKEIMATDASRFEAGWGIDPVSLYPDKEKHILAFDLIYCCSTYNLYNGLPFDRPTSKEKQLARERKEKAEDYSNKYEEAKAEKDKLEEAILYLKDVFAEGADIISKNYGKGVVISNNGSNIEADFAKDKGKTFGMIMAASKGFISSDMDGYKDKIDQYRDILSRDSKIRSDYKLAEKNYVEYAEYL